MYQVKEIHSTKTSAMEIEQLRHFMKVAEYSNFTKAAVAIPLSQPALSRSIARLEDELGQPLFERQTRKVALTDAGNLLFGRARQILSMIDDVKAEINDDGQTGQVRVAAIPTIAPYFLPSKLREFHRSYPHAKVIVQEDTTDNLLKKLYDGVVDVAIAAVPIDAKYLKVESLFEEELLLVTASESPLAKKPTIRASDIESLPFVLLGEAHCLTNSVVSYCQQKSFHPVSVERTSQLAMVQELVSLNHGVSLVPEMARALDTSDRRVYRSLQGTKPMRTIVMITNPYRFQSILQSKFQETIRRSMPSKAIRPERR
jgi:LysR family transcriptional regulator, hydrogen peroxide-inducible genes activator